MSLPTARITAQHLQTGQFNGRLVRAVGKLVNEDGNIATLQLAGEGPTASIHCPGGTSEFSGMSGKGYYEIVGTLNHDGTIAQMQTVFMGENFDLNMYAEMVTLTHQFPDLF
uniref:Replication factor A protein 3 n=1 Tax=Haptolina ericina TaxID=156174 RepID=A0A7S3AQ41_9EUKA|mmetsp:Transcript_30117/g.68008  ORF Transcript_30117/g.68008 Transcript_30117/m.68008 type:complete len:112 (+) Transcript_30117:26-361(+)|eukprot:CAMPEP_0181186366 /NCGR_PEP_ID=MMETSP1096-20121128/9995_1 /TAXON_ID=156174 ORGANISM="Chrysochromulina ericina, Strain CCMP281" /NCGR_SAMPLE_ID=MMETSP1096 /ASSEMBLY_ACC=CAM_ASM_000453 /LENGTH=111 /DNA_ID=CAMNT_0023275257 /DNA_START=20 /DNA_END=355 /DNA_ORIENTATION=-